jgi:hypothetical protein
MVLLGVTVLFGCNRVPREFTGEPTYVNENGSLCCSVHKIPLGKRSGYASDTAYMHTSYTKRAADAMAAYPNTHPEQIMATPDEDWNIRTEYYVCEKCIDEVNKYIEQEH